MSNTNNTGLPPAQGLYRPEFEHDSCGVGFVAHIKGERSHQIIARRGPPAVPHGSPRRARRRAEHRRRRRHAHGAAARVPREGREAASSASTLPRARQVRRGHRVPADRRRPSASAARRSSREICAEEGQTLVGWRVVPTTSDGRRRRRRRARRRCRRSSSCSSRPAPGVEGDAFERKLYLIRKRASHRAARRQDAAPGEAVLHLQPVEQDR